MIISGTPQTISPTDVSQFVRLEQCQRFLALRIRERREGTGFLRDYGVAPQAIPPLLTEAGGRFERRIEDEVEGALGLTRLNELTAEEGRRAVNNDDVAELVRALEPGEVRVLSQSRLETLIDGWLLRGDADLIRLSRDEHGELDALVVDIKSSTSPKVEHRLQLAFYQLMLQRVLDEKGVPVREDRVRTAILYRGAPDFPAGVADEDVERLLVEREAAETLLGATSGFLEIVDRPEAYLESVDDLVIGPVSVAREAAELPIEETSFHLTYKCDGCLYNEYCMKQCAEADDLSLIPHLTAVEKRVLHGHGIETIRKLAALKELDGDELRPAPGKEELSAALAATWPVGPRLDELIHRARRYRKWKGDDLEALSYIPSKGYGSLPYCDAEHNPNLVRVYIDAQHDYLEDRIYMLGALVAACEGGEETPERRRIILDLSDGPPDTAAKESELFVGWTRDLMRAIVEVAAPDEQGRPRAPIHLIFYDRYGQQVLLDGLSRQLHTLLGATPLYDFVTQLAAFDSPLVTFLSEEIRELKNYPMVCHSLQQVAAYLRFEWDDAHRNEIFRERLFDFWRKFDEEEVPREEGLYYAGRARFNSQIPLEYAYCAWGVAPAPNEAGGDLFARYRRATVDHLLDFQASRLEAIEHITKRFSGNRYTTKTLFELPDLSSFEDVARSLAHALEEFVTIERHVSLASWRQVRNLAPERRVLMGETLVLRYDAEQQEPEVLKRLEDAKRRDALRRRYEAEYRERHPNQEKVKLTKAQWDEVSWTLDGHRVRFEVDTTGLACSLTEALALSTLREGDRVVLYERETVDTRLPPDERTPFTPTPKQLLYGSRASIHRIEAEVDERGNVLSASIVLEMLGRIHAGDWARQFVFSSFERIFQHGERYTIDPSPDDWYGYFQSVVTQQIIALEDRGAPEGHALYHRLVAPEEGAVDWPEAAREAQAQFFAGLAAFHEAGLLHAFERRQRDYIERAGEVPILLVQGPPGTGKSYTTAFAILARIQGAMAAGLDYRVFVSCKTHAATDVLLAAVVSALDTLGRLAGRDREMFEAYCDPRLLKLPLYRIAGRATPPEGVVALERDNDKPDGSPKNADILRQHPWVIAAATPGGIYRLVKDRVGSPRNLMNLKLAHCLVLDEASQMNLPEAAMAALPLHPHGQLVVVGDHRQMPPIVKHDWEAEPRRTFRIYETYRSLFDTLRQLPSPPPMIQLERSFRLHTTMAEFLRREIYARDGIGFFSERTDTLDRIPHVDPFVEAVLDPRYPIVVIVHDERGSQTRNRFEQRLIAPVVEALEEADFDALEGLGVVVPHRAQRAEMQGRFPFLSQRDADGVLVDSAVDTVERFQGGERSAIIVSATESDRDYLLAASTFLFDPRRLTVATSRAQHKMILVAGRTVFELFSPDEQTFHNVQLWKNLLRRTCDVPLWAGEREGMPVQVWGASE